MRITILSICLLFLISCKSQKTEVDYSAYEQSEFETDYGILSYRVLLPKNYNENKVYPLVLFLHGAGERGNDNEAQLAHGADLFLKKDVREKYPAIVIFPQCPEESYWSNVDKKKEAMSFTFTFSAEGEPTEAMKMLQGFLPELKRSYNIDESRMYVGGLSMGGMGTFEIVRRNPDTFAAAFAICGGAHPDTASQLINQPWWIFHGDSDVVVDYEHSKEMVAALKKAGAEVKFNTYEGVNHNSWENAFAEPELIPWLFANSK